MQEKAVPLESVLESYAGVPVLVIGASGFIGRWVAGLLTKAGAELYLPARDCAGAKRTFLRYGIRGDIFKVDLLEFGRLRRLIGEIRPTVIFNLAGYGVDKSERSEELAYQINTELPKAICSSVGSTPAATNWTGQRVVHVGSAMEYGDVIGDLSESSPVRPTTLYGKSKAAGTEAVSSICREELIAGVTARLFAVYGPGESEDRLLPTVIAASRHNRSIELTAGTHKRDFTYVEDVAEALLRLGISDCPAGEIVNVATGNLTSIRSFVRTAADILNVEESRLSFGALPTRREEMAHDPVSIEKLLNLTGWKPNTKISDGVRKASSILKRDSDVQLTAGVTQRVCELF